MRAAPFDYQRVDSVEAALAALSEHGEDAQILAGGQSLLPTMALRMARPGMLVDIGRIEALRAIAVEDGCLVLGACATYRDMLASKLVSENAPLLAQAIPHVAHEAVRSRGTIGGSLANADPASEMPACMMALGARIVLASPAGRREVLAEDFVLGTYSTALEPGEIVVAIRIPVAAPQGRHQHFREISRRAGDYAIVGGALAGHVRGGTVRGARLALFAVSDRAVRVVGAGAALEGRPADVPDIDAVLAAIDAEVEFFPDAGNGVATKRHLARVIAADLVGRLARPPASLP